MDYFLTTSDFRFLTFVPAVQGRYCRPVYEDPAFPFVENSAAMSASVLSFTGASGLLSSRSKVDQLAVSCGTSFESFNKYSVVTGGETGNGKLGLESARVRLPPVGVGGFKM